MMKTADRRTRTSVAPTAGAWRQVSGLLIVACMGLLMAAASGCVQSPYPGWAGGGPTPFPAQGSPPGNNPFKPNPVPLPSGANPYGRPQPAGSLGPSGEMPGLVAHISAYLLVLTTDRNVSIELPKGTQLTFEIGSGTKVVEAGKHRYKLPAGADLPLSDIQRDDLVTVDYVQRSGRLLATKIYMRAGRGQFRY